MKGAKVLAVIYLLLVIFGFAFLAATWYVKEQHVRCDEFYELWTESENESMRYRKIAIEAVDCANQLDMRIDANLIREKKMYDLWIDCMKRNEQ